MAEYIEREKARDAIEDADSYYTYVIDRLPSADVAPVTHGHWKEESDYDGDSIYVCSECGETWTLIDGTPQDNNMHYCPNCGARMEDES